MAHTPDTEETRESLVEFLSAEILLLLHMIHKCKHTVYEDRSVSFGFPFQFTVHTSTTDLRQLSHGCSGTGICKKN